MIARKKLLEQQTNDKINIINLKKNKVKENIILDFRLKQIDETRNFPLEEIKHNDLMNEKHKNVCRALNYFEHFLVFACAVSLCALLLSVGVLARTESSAVGL